MTVLQKFLTDVDKAKTAEEVFKCFAIAINELGYDVSIYVFLAPFDIDKKKPHRIVLVHSKKNPELINKLMDEYKEENLERLNPGHQYGRQTGEIIAWYGEHANIDQEYNPFRQKIYDAGLTSGAGVPLFGVGNEIAFAHVVNFEESGPVLIDSPEIQIVRLMAYRLHELIRNMIKDPIDIPKLSPREVEVMKWVMKGKSDSVIADILEISEHTVGTYIKRCYQKLGVSSRATAAARALSLGLIKP